MCKCKNIKLGSYDRQTDMKPPYRDMWICIDTCLVQEIAELWALGIQTTGCCCGHNKAPAYIGVKENCIEKMKEMGYKVLKNNLYPEREDSFIPKTV